jgi:hypothetical protein
MKCGKKYDVETVCCNEEMDVEDNVLVCNNCGNEAEVPSCCGAMKRIDE